MTTLNRERALRLPNQSEFLREISALREARPNFRRRAPLLFESVVFSS